MISKHIKPFCILNTIGEQFTPGAKKLLEKEASVDYLIPSQAEFPKIINKYDAVLLGLGLVLKKAVLEKAKLLRVIATATTGLDHIDIEYAQEKNIKILSLRDEDEFLNTITSTSELAFSLLLCLARFVPWSFEEVKNGKWLRENFRGHTLSGKTLGIVGMGRLGSIMAKQAKGFGMNIIFFDPNKQNLNPSEYKKVSFKELLCNSDAISIHVHLAKETENMFGKNEFYSMKKTAYLINTSRGKIVDENALLEVLQKKHIAGYATDVLADELKFGGSVLNHTLVEYSKTHRNCIIVPHIGGMTIESRELTDIFIAKKLVRYLKQL